MGRYDHLVDIIPPMNNVTSTEPLTPDRLRESLDLFSSTTVSSALYTIVLMLYCLSFHHFYRKARDGHYRRVAIFSLVHASLVTLWCTIFLALMTWSMQDIYLNHATYPGGPYQYEVHVFSRQAISPLTSASSFMLGILTLGIQVWRVWVIWSSTRYRIFIIAVPVILFLAFFGLGLLSILVWAIPNVLPNERNKNAISTTVYGVGAATTIVITILAVARLLLVRRYHIKVMGKSDISNQYVNIVAIITESYALESVWSLIAMVLNAVDNPVNIIFIQCENFIRVIAYFLVVHRISTGRAWNGKTGNELSTLQWNHTTDPESVQSETFVQTG